MAERTEIRRLGWYILFAALLIGLSVLGFAVQISLFHRTSDTFFYILQDLAFLPIEVLLVTIVINGLLHMRERNERQRKMGMVIGIFFTEMGNTLVRYFSEFDVNLEEMRDIARLRKNWSVREFAATRRRLEQHEYNIDCQCANMNDLKRLLDGNRSLLLGLLANPSLLENAHFTQLLWAIWHLIQELDVRPDLDHLPDEDYAHLASDMRRAYVKLVFEWLSYVKQLRDEQPYMLSLLMRMNPFDPHPSPIVQDEKAEEEADAG